MECFRELYEQCIAYTGYALYPDVLETNLDAACQLMKPLQKFRSLRNAPPVEREDTAGSGLYELFGLNVLNDYLLFPLTVSQQEYRQFFTALGLELFVPNGVFTPHLCEIVSVENFGTPEAGINIGSCYWPGLRFGELIFSRCAVDVYCHSSLLTKGIADRSTLYFTHARMHRKCEDLSHGWGSNSRWRTRFHRNYESGDFVFLNVDGDGDLSRGYTPSRYSGWNDDDLPVQAARELLLHRCFVQYEDPHEDPFPYDWQLALRNESPLWPLQEEKIMDFEEALYTVVERPPGLFQRVWDHLKS